MWKNCLIRCAKQNKSAQESGPSSSQGSSYWPSWGSAITHQHKGGRRSCRGRWTWEHVKNAETCGQERTEDEWKAEVELPTGQSQRPVYTSCYVKWILNSLQHKSDHLKMLEDKEPITTLKPKLLKRAGILQGNCSFFQWDKLLRVSANKLIWFLLLEVTVNQEIPSFRKGIV